MLTIQNILDNINPYAMAYKNMHQIELEENNNAANEGRPVPQVTMRLRAGADRRRYNLPHHFFKHHASKLKRRINSFSQITVNNWNAIPTNVVEAPSVNSFKERLDIYWKNLFYTI